MSLSVLVLAVAMSALSRPVMAAGTASNDHLLTIHEGSQTRGIITHEDTLEDALRHAGIAVTDQDLVEPNLSTQLVAANYDVNIYRALPVTIQDGATQKRVMSPYRVADQIAKHADMQLNPQDKTSISTSSDVTANGPGLVVKIDRATPFTLVLYGKSVQSYTRAKTVGAMLADKGVKLANDDTLSVDQNAPLTTGMTVEVWRNGVQTTTAEEPVAFTTRQVQDADQPIGYKKVQTPGKIGKKMVTYEITMKNGQQVDKKEIQSVVTEQPTEQVEVVGAKMTNTFSGDFAGALARLRSCEGSYTSNTGNGYYGAYQYDIQTWGNYQGYANASLAPPAIQDQKAWETYQRRGWQPWPSCSHSQGLQDIYR